MKIHVDRIPFEGQHFAQEEPAAQYDIAYLDFVFSDPIRVDVTVQVISGNLVVSGKIATKVRMTCSRCLKGFSQEWMDPSYNFDCQIGSPNEIIDLTADIREDIITNLPIKPLCAKDCKGLCPVCGIDWNTATCECAKRKTDIRWSGLDKLQRG